MYTHDPDSLKWAGLASYASNAIGSGLAEAGDVATACAASAVAILVLCSLHVD